MSKVIHKTLVSETEVSAYLHRSRMAILRALRNGKATASQVADELGVHSANITRHLRILEEAKLISLVEKRDTGRNLEKYYEAIASTFDVCPEAEGLTAPHKLALVFARSELSAALSRLPDDDPDAVLVRVVSAKVPKRRMNKYLKELTRISENFNTDGGEQGSTYHMVIAAYPGDESSTDRNERIALTSG